MCPLCLFVANGLLTIQVLDVLNPALDTDGDGLVDLEEIIVYKTNPLLTDTDADGFSDFTEIITYGFNA